jgi:sensor histidine kinase regulating citrate/malate metabolism
MSNLTRDFITLVLVIVIGFLIHLLYVQEKDEDKQQNLKINELHIERDSIVQELQESNQQRDSFRLTADSIRRSNERLITLVVKKDSLIRIIPGRYNKWGSDSLGREMDRRADVRQAP